MKKYGCNYFDTDGNTHVAELTEDEIISSYFKFWQGMIRDKKEREPDFVCDETRENCIEDWIAINWAWEVK